MFVTKFNCQLTSNHYKSMHNRFSRKTAHTHIVRKLWTGGFKLDQPNVQESVVMDIFKEFLESSTIHGLVYISTSKTRVQP